MNTGAAGNLCKRRTVKSETRHPAPNQFACWHPALKVFCMLGLCKDLGCDKLAGCAYGAVIDKGIARWGGGAYIKLHARSAHLMTYSNSHSSCRCVAVSCNSLCIHTGKVLLGSA